MNAIKRRDRCTMKTTVERTICKKLADANGVRFLFTVTSVRMGRSGGRPCMVFAMDTAAPIQKRIRVFADSPEYEGLLLAMGTLLPFELKGRRGVVMVDGNKLSFFPEPTRFTVTDVRRAMDGRKPCFHVRLAMEGMRHSPEFVIVPGEWSYEHLLTAIGAASLRNAKGMTGFCRTADNGMGGAVLLPAGWLDERRVA